MPNMVAIYLSPDFRPIYELLDEIAYRDRTPMSTLMKRALTQWAVDHAELDPAYVIKKDADQEMRTQIGSKSPCRFRMMTSPSSLVCKADGRKEQKGIGACLDCEDYEPRTVT